MTSLLVPHVARLNVASKYFHFLYGKIADGNNYRKLCRYLNGFEFTFFVPNDDNRHSDGYDLRYQFLEYLTDIGQPITQRQIDNLLENPVSVFEVLVALTDRMDFQLYDNEIPPRNPTWFQEMLTNLGISDLVDRKWSYVAERDTERVIRMLLDRTYDENGEGSLFPLEHPREDMTRVEIWYQMMAYILEKYPV